MIPPHVLCALADFYDVSVDYLLGRTDERKGSLKFERQELLPLFLCLAPPCRQHEQHADDAEDQAHPQHASAPPQSMAYPARKLPNMAPRPLEAIIIMDWPFTWSTGETFALA